MCFQIFYKNGSTMRICCKKCSRDKGCKRRAVFTDIMGYERLSKEIRTNRPMINIVVKIAKQHSL